LRLLKRYARKEVRMAGSVRDVRTGTIDRGIIPIKLSTYLDVRSRMVASRAETVGPTIEPQGLIDLAGHEQAHRARGVVSALQHNVRESQELNRVPSVRAAALKPHLRAAEVPYTHISKIGVPQPGGVVVAAAPRHHMNSVLFVVAVGLEGDTLNQHALNRTRVDLQDSVVTGARHSQNDRALRACTNQSCAVTYHQAVRHIGSSRHIQDQSMQVGEVDSVLEPL
jgi:hypothetical protein